MKSSTLVSSCWALISTFVYSFKTRNGSIANTSLFKKKRSVVPIACYGLSCSQSFKSLVGGWVASKDIFAALLSPDATFQFSCKAHLKNTQMECIEERR